MQDDMVFGTGKGQCKTTCCLLLVKVNAGRHAWCLVLVNADEIVNGILWHW